MKRAGAAWPVLKTYDAAHLDRIALPLGGIGTGTVSLGGRGQLQDWELMSRPAKGFSPKNTFFALYARPAGGPAVTRAIEAPIPVSGYEGGSGATTPNHGLPRFRHGAFKAAYPFGQVLLSDPGVPVSVRLQAFNPLVPCDTGASGIPAAVLRFELKNRTARAVTASVCGSIENYIGHDGTNGKADKNINEFRTSAAPAVQGVLMRSDGVAPDAEQYGTIALSVLAARGVTARTAWAELSWGDALLDFWDDFSGDGALDARAAGRADSPMASLCASVRLPPRGARSVTFLITWRFPNRLTWTPSKQACDCGRACGQGDNVGNYYAGEYSDAWDVALRTAAALPGLEERTLSFVRAFCESDIPAAAKEAALFNLANLRSQTVFRIADGHMLGWEGCCDRNGCCHGSCTHVWNYEAATALLFGDLARSMREVEFLHATDERGLMSFRVNLPLSRGTQYGHAAADGQMGCLVKLYREWQLSGDDAWLRRLWPMARRALEFCWIPGGWDADRDGVMEGCQHNTMDVEYYGPNPQMGGWYLAALKAAWRMAESMGEREFADACRALFERGRAWMDANLFNGEYYEHEIRPPKSEAAIAKGLRVGMGSPNLQEPDLQLGAGCLVDQLAGQYMAHVSGLGYLLEPGHVRKTLKSIMKYNFRETLYAHFNHLRTFALNGESALLMASYPRGRRPRRPFPYYNEVMTGFEYTAAVHMLYEGLADEGLKAIRAIRSRYDGRKRSPFNEAECGHHYSRAMAAWSAVPALTGFSFSAVERAIGFAARPGASWFWSNGSAWGVCRQRKKGTGVHATLRVLQGRLTLSRFALAGLGEALFDTPVIIEAPGELNVFVKKTIARRSARNGLPGAADRCRP